MHKLFKINQTGFAPSINSYTNFGEGIGLFGANTSNDSLLMNYLEGNLLVIQRNSEDEENFEKSTLEEEHTNIKNAIVGRKNPAILKHL